MADGLTRQTRDWRQRGLGFAGPQVIIADPRRAQRPHEASRCGRDPLVQNARARRPSPGMPINADPPPRPADCGPPRTVGQPDECQISVGGTPAGTVATTTDDAWRSAFSVFLGAVRLARGSGDLGDSRGHPSRDAIGRVLCWLPVRVRWRIPPSPRALPGLWRGEDTRRELGPAGSGSTGSCRRIATDCPRTRCAQRRSDRRGRACLNTSAAQLA
jgi:hypothetical protein